MVDQVTQARQELARRELTRRATVQQPTIEQPIDPTAAGIPTQFATGVPVPGVQRQQEELLRQGPDAISRVGAAFAQPFEETEFGLSQETIDKFKTPDGLFNTFNQVILEQGVSPAVALLEGVGATSDAAVDAFAQVMREAGTSRTDAESFKRDAKGLLMMGGLFAGRPSTAPRTAARRTTQADEVIEAGERAGVPVLTSDVLPPTTFAGRIAQSSAEKIPVIGTGGIRSAQQVDRQSSVSDLAREFGADLDTAFDARIIRSLGDVKNANKAKAVGFRNSAIDTLKPFGNVEVPQSLKVIDDEIARAASLREKADPRVIENLRQVRLAIIDGDFEHVKNIRTEVISDIKALQKGDFTVLPSKAEAGLQKVKSSIDKDMLQFAQNNDRKAAADWVRSNRLFAEEFTKFKDSELKRLISKGDLTPEVVDSVIFGGKRSELNRLFNNINKEGRSNVRGAIIQRALQRSGFPDDVNPNNFLRALNQESTRKATKTFFRGADDKALRGFKKLLEATKRAQDAAVTTPTGQQLIPFAIGGSAIASPIATLGTLGTVSTAARIYESAAFRNSLLKMANLKTNTKAFAKEAAKLTALINSAVQAEKRQEN